MDLTEKLWSILGGRQPARTYTVRALSGSWSFRDRMAALRVVEAFYAIDPGMRVSLTSQVTR